MKLSYRIPGSDTPPRLEITRDERGLTIRVGRLKEFTNRVHTVGNYLAGFVIVLVANGGIALAMIRAMARGRRLEALHLLVVESLVGLVMAVVILVLHDRHNRWAIFNVNSDGLRIGTHGPFGVRRRFFRRDRIISIECQKSHDQAPADDWSAWHYLAVTTKLQRTADVAESLPRGFD